MFKKRKVRELAMQVLFMWDTAGSSELELGQQFIREGCDDLEVRRQALQWATAAWEQRQITDSRVEQLAPQWPTRRQPGVDRNIIRLAAWELSHGHTPPKVTIDEAIEMAKEFSTEQSAAFVNGVLDAMLKENEKLTAEPNLIPSPGTPGEG